MQTIANRLADPTIHNCYLAFCLVVLVVPAVLLSRWYHRNIRGTKEGDELMRRQVTAAPRTRRGYADVPLMMRDISSGKYGKHVKKLQNAMYCMTGIWLVLCVIAFGILIVADEMNK